MRSSSPWRVIITDKRCRHGQRHAGIFLTSEAQFSTIIEVASKLLEETKLPYTVTVLPALRALSFTELPVEAEMMVASDASTYTSRSL